MTECTGLAAKWCPVHGDCICGRVNLALELAEDQNLDCILCPLHSAGSDHPNGCGRWSDGRC